jgi:hypothetical protein
VVKEEEKNCARSFKGWIQKKRVVINKVAAIVEFGILTRILLCRLVVLELLQQNLLPEEHSLWNKSSHYFLEGRKENGNVIKTAKHHHLESSWIGIVTRCQILCQVQATLSADCPSSS